MSTAGDIPVFPCVRLHPMNEENVKTKSEEKNAVLNQRKSFVYSPENF